MATKKDKDNGSKPTTTRRSRRVATAPANILASCIAELDKLDGAEREKVLRSIHAYYGGKAGATLRSIADPDTRTRDQQIVDEEVPPPEGGRFA